VTKPFGRGSFLAIALAASALVFAVACEEEGDLGDTFETTPGAATPSAGGALGGTATPSTGGALGGTATPSTGGALGGTATPSAGGLTGTATPLAGAATGTPTPLAGATGTPQAGQAGVATEPFGRFNPDQGFFAAVTEMMALADVTEIRLDVTANEIVIVSGIEEDAAQQICDNIEETALFLFGTVRFEDDAGTELASCEVDEVTSIVVDFDASEIQVEVTWTQDDADKAQNLCDALDGLFMQAAAQAGGTTGTTGQEGQFSIVIMGEGGEELARCGAEGTGTSGITGGTATPTPGATGTPGAGGTPAATPGAGTPTSTPSSGS
jgi:hypothetical protein